MLWDYRCISPLDDYLALCVCAMQFKHAFKKQVEESFSGLHCSGWQVWVLVSGGLQSKRKPLTYHLSKPFSVITVLVLQPYAMAEGPTCERELAHQQNLWAKTKPWDITWHPHLSAFGMQNHENKASFTLCLQLWYPIQEKVGCVRPFLHTHWLPGLEPNPHYSWDQAVGHPIRTGVSSLGT